MGGYALFVSVTLAVFAWLTVFSRLQESCQSGNYPGDDEDGYAVHQT